MADQREILTDKGITRLRAAEKQYRVRDGELPGFFVLVGKRRKTFMAQGEFWRDGVREFAAQVKLGDFGEMTTRQARGKAKEALGLIAKGQRPGETPKIKLGSITLRQAWERYRDAHMKRKGRSLGPLRAIEITSSDFSRIGSIYRWLGSADSRISLLNATTRLRGKTPLIANGAMRSLRAVYNHARKSNTDLPAANPVSAIDWNKEHRRNTGMGRNDICVSGSRSFPQWTTRSRREFHLLTLFRGHGQLPLRRSA